MTTEERLLSLERSISFHKKTTLALLLLCVCLLSTGLAANQEAEDITVKSIKFMGENGKDVAVMKTSGDNSITIERSQKSRINAGILIVLEEEQTGIQIKGTDGMARADATFSD